VELRCADLGLSCSGKVTGDTEEELERGLERHAAEKHDVPQLNATLVDYAMTRARSDGGGKG
jgi:predicted small metal-binding protein